MKPALILALAACAACAPRTWPAAPAPMPQAEGQPEVAESPSSVRPVPTAAGTPEVDTPAPAVLAVATGEATYYADRFNGRRTASGVVFRNDEYFAAHRTWPFGTVVRVTRVSNGRSVLVTVVDRGPHGSSERQRRTIIDVSRRAAEELGFVSAGRTPVQVEVLHWGG